MALDKIQNNEPPQIPVETLDPELALLLTAVADDEAYKEEQARRESGVTAEVVQIQGNVNKTLSTQGVDNKSTNTGEGVQMGTKPLPEAYMYVLEKVATTGDLGVQMGTKPLPEVYKNVLGNIA